MIEKDYHGQIKNRYLKVVERVYQLCEKFDRKPESVKLVVVTKGHSTEDISEVISAGAKYLGENYVEETARKKEELGKLSNQVDWHMIGHIQSRKTNLVPFVYDYIQSIDRFKVANRLNQQLLKEGKKIPVLLQYNVGGEEQKYGWEASDENNWHSLLPEFLDILGLSQLCVMGLMTMPPYSTDNETALTNFYKLRKLRDFFQKNVDGLELRELSMGTSHDFEAAIQAGATIIRIGTAIMGERIYK
ncbi:MAG: YggS family pyridoxal phosphate-dependent enzyme [Anaerolineaceae bacterium]|nr:YggS family pyridoxal phosphate-dependent enzyme [Anaerolineaceae bacterium]